MTDLRKAAEMALEALEWIANVNAMDYEYQRKANEPIAALRQALAQPESWDTSDMAHRTGGLSVEQEPVAWLEYDDDGYLFLSGKRKDAFPVFTAPPSKPWVSLTDDEIDLLITLHAPPIHPDFNDDDDFIELVEAIEAALKEKNNG